MASKPGERAVLEVKVRQQTNYLSDPEDFVIFQMLFLSAYMERQLIVVPQFVSNKQISIHL